MQLANHCNKALDKETLSLLYPLGDFSHTNINISASNLSDVYIKIVFIGAYTKTGMPEPPSGYSNDSVSLSKALLLWLANYTIKDSWFQNYSRFPPYLKCTVACKVRFKGTVYPNNPNQMGKMIPEWA